MNRFRRHCLIISIVCFSVCALGIVTLAHGETSALVRYEPENNSFKPGIGAELNHETRLKSFAIGASGGIASQKKHGAEDGFTWNYGGYGKWFPVEQWFIGGGYSWGGYRSRFVDHGTWEKKAGQVSVMAGYQDDKTEIRFTYWPHENDTPNRVSGGGVLVRHKLTDVLMVSFGYQLFKYTQSGSRETDLTLSLGAGIYF